MLCDTVLVVPRPNANANGSGGGGGGKDDSALKEKLSKYKKELKRLQKKNKELEKKLDKLGSGRSGSASGKRSALEEAQQTDKSLNHAAPVAKRPDEEQAALFQQWRQKPFVFKLAHKVGVLCVLYCMHASEHVLYWCS